MESNGADKLGRKLLKIKEELEEKKAKRLELQGELKSLINQLKELGVNSLEEAEEMIHQTEKDLEKMRESIEEQIGEIEELMEGGEGDCYEK
jgi:predicted  nucleic acid-binding Zn-ribbon protein